jgi:Arc/MetJ-type ribon-helix-helix transcriptional regulator
MTIDLPQVLEERARAKVAAGEYSSVADVVRAGLEALALLEDEAYLHDDAFLTAARQRWAEGDVAVARGDYFEGSPRAIMDRIRAKAGNPA